MALTNREIDHVVFDCSTLARIHAPGTVAFGKNSCWPLIL